MKIFQIPFLIEFLQILKIFNLLFTSLLLRLRLIPRYLTLGNAVSLVTEKNYLSSAYFFRFFSTNFVFIFFSLSRLDTILPFLPLSLWMLLWRCIHTMYNIPSYQIVGDILTYSLLSSFLFITSLHFSSLHPFPSPVISSAPIVS